MARFCGISKRFSLRGIHREQGLVAAVIYTHSSNQLDLRKCWFFSPYFNVDIILPNMTTD